MTKQDWEYVEKRLKRINRQVDLLCDGYELTLVLVQVNESCNEITFAVGGWFNGSWILNDCEERRRFCRKCVEFVYSPKIRSALRTAAKKYGKKWAEEHLPDPDKKFIGYSSFWTSFKELKKHLIENNQDIRLIKTKKSEVTDETKVCTD
ncbi:MAG: hypothetical protein AB1847_18440 [bacterium]